MSLASTGQDAHTSEIMDADSKSLLASMLKAIESQPKPEPPNFRENTFKTLVGLIFPPCRRASPDPVLASHIRAVVECLAEEFRFGQASHSADIRMKLLHPVALEILKMYLQLGVMMGQVIAHVARLPASVRRGSSSDNKNCKNISSVANSTSRT